jgi:hypothetical protein
MHEYLKKMKATPHTAPAPKDDPPIVLAAILPRMLALAAAETRGTHTYFVPPEHTAWAREIVGPDKWLCAEQAVMLESDPVKARAAARNYMGMYLPTPARFRIQEKPAELWLRRARFWRAAE